MKKFLLIAAFLLFAPFCYADGDQYEMGYYATTGSTLTGNSAIVTDSSNNLLVSTKVGIGTTDPDKVLHVRFSEHNGITTDRAVTSIYSGHTWLNNGTANERWFIGMIPNSDTFVIRNRSTNNGDIVLIEDQSQLNSIYVKANGNVGVRTSNPGSTLDVKGTLRLSGSTSGYVGLAPAAAAGSTTYTLPAADGTSGQVLSTNGSGTLSWATDGGSSQWTTTGSDIYYDTGDVGIGTTSPGSALDVKGTLRLSGSTSGYVGFVPAAAAGSTTYTLPAADGSSGQVLSTNGSGTLSWASNGSSQWTTSGSDIYYNSGNVGIGLSNPAFVLHVAGVSYMTSNTTTAVTLEVANSSSTDYANALLGKNTAVNYYCYLGTNSYALLCNGPTNGVSDERLKKDIRPLDMKEGLDAIMKLRPVHYRWKDERMNKPHPNGGIGFTAQNVESVLPELVGETRQQKDTPIKLPGGKQKGLEYDRLTAPIVLAIQQQQAQIDELKQMIKQLKEAK